MSMTENVIELPDPIPYPKIFNINNVKELMGKFCYIIKRYPENGYGMLIYRHDDTVCVRISDFSGRLLDPTQEEKFKPIMEYSRKIIITMRLIGLKQALFYFSENKLVDMRLSINKFCGPGYLSDFFGKQGIPTQENVMEPAIIDDEKLNYLLSTKDEYIIKPSSFKFMVRDEMVYPLYGIVNNETKLPI